MWQTTAEHPQPGIPRPTLSERAAHGNNANPQRWPVDLQAYSFLERKRDAAAAQEAREAGADLEKLNDMAHELLMTGSVSAHSC